MSTENITLNTKQDTLLRMVVETADRLDGTCPNIYSRYGNTLRALSQRGLVTFSRNSISDRCVYTAVPTEAGRKAVQA
jgi:hypothetical protein